MNPLFSISGEHKDDGRMPSVQWRILFISIAALDILFYSCTGLGLNLVIAFLLFLSISIPWGGEFWSVKRLIIAVPAVTLTALGLLWDSGFWAVMTAFGGVMMIRMAWLRGWSANVWEWLLRFLFAYAFVFIEPFYWLYRRIFPKETVTGNKESSFFKRWGIPLFGGVFFGILFLIANPVAARYAGSLFSDLSAWIGHFIFWFFAGWVLIWVRLGLWNTLSPKAKTDFSWTKVWLPPSTVARALVVFNLVFLLNNVLDIEYLWAGAALPEGMTYAEYAHRGAYPLIITILFAALSIMFFFGNSRSHEKEWKWARIGVYAWLAQNFFLLLSAVLRLVKYVDVYHLTPWRISSFIFFAVVGIGLILTLIFIMKHRSVQWLVNSCLTVFFSTLFIGSVSDIRGFAANWNADVYLKASDKSETLFRDTEDLPEYASSRRSKSVHPLWVEVKNSGMTALPAMERIYRNPDNGLDTENLRDLGITILTERQALEKIRHSWCSWTLRAATLDISPDTSFIKGILSSDLYIR